MKVHLEYGEFRVDMEGTPDDVFSGFMDFIKKSIPTLELASRLMVAVDLRGAAEALEGLVAIQPTGPVPLTNGELTLKDRISLLLAGAYIGGQLKITERDTLAPNYLTDALGVKAGTLSKEISRMREKGLLEVVGRGVYRATPLCLKGVLETSRKIKEREGNCQ
ncbi:MAG: hypothetical protein QXJ75_00215 [Candidatus Bathyarchaeia archaeon]